MTFYRVYRFVYRLPLLWGLKKKTHTYSEYIVGLLKY